MKCYASVCPALLMFAAHAFASVTISNPSQGALVVSPFVVNASATACRTQTIAGMAYWLDNSRSVSTAYGGSTLNVQVSAPVGAHTLHVAAMTRFGFCASSSVAVSVVPSPVAAVPTWAVVVSSIQALAGWQAAVDAGTGSGTASGSMQLTGSPSLSGTALSLLTNYTNSEGERYDVVFDSDTASSNFLYDTWIDVAAPSSGVANLEFDVSQVLANGQTVIFGVQCDGYSFTWDYTMNAGTPTAFVDKWVHSTAPCNPRSWSTNTWHHLQLSYSRDSAGNVTYKAVYLDGVEQVLNATVPSSFALGWASVLLTNFQVDGLGANGTVTTYLDNMTVYRW